MNFVNYSYLNHPIPTHESFVGNSQGSFLQIYQVALSEDLRHAICITVKETSALLFGGPLDSNLNENIKAKCSSELRWAWEDRVSELERAATDKWPWQCGRVDG